MVMLPTKEPVLFSRSDQMLYREGLLLNSLMVFMYVLELPLQNKRFPCPKGLCAFPTQILLYREMLMQIGMRVKKVEKKNIRT